MQKLQVLFAFLFLSLCFSSCTSNDKSAVTKQVESFTEALTKGNGDLSSYWSADAEVINPMTGDAIDGQEAIAKYFDERRADVKGKKVTFTIGNITFPEEDLAVVEGVLEIEGKEGKPYRAARRIELVKENGKWLLDYLKEIRVDLPPTAYEHLKDLDFLIGNWKDEDEDVNIEFNTSWDKFKNFITQNFTLGVYGVDALEGSQLIGWDPVASQIRSWVHDSDGGFGIGVWTKSGDSWNVAIDFTLSDGKKGGATDTYTKIDDKSYSFASTNRIVDGVSLPNIDPVTVVKEN